MIEEDDSEDGVRDALFSLRDGTDNDEVLRLLEVLQRMNAHNRRLEDRIERLESIADPDLDAPLQANYDTYDETVLGILQESGVERVNMDQFKRLYRRNTRLQQDEAIRERVKTLTSIGPFENTRPGVWIFHGFPESSD